MEHMSLCHISELNGKSSIGKMVMLLGFFENYSPYDEGRAQLLSCEESCSLSVNLDLSACEPSNFVEHTICRIVGTVVKDAPDVWVKVQSLVFVPTWRYETFEKIIMVERRLASS